MANFFETKGLFNPTLRRVVAIFFVAIVAGFISLPNTIPLDLNLGSVHIKKTLVRPNLNIKIGNISIQRNFDLALGLDLAGGSHLVFQADTSKIDPSQKKAAIDSVKQVIEKRVNLFGVSEPNVQTSSFEGKESIIVELPGVKDTSQAISIIGKTAQLVFAQTTSDQKGFEPTDLTGADLKSSSVVFNRTTGKPEVSIEFNQDGAQKFADLTKNNVGKPLAIILDNQLVSAPIVQQEITGGSAVISGDFTTQQAKDLSIQLNAGALPVPVKLVEQTTVGATLGAESVSKSINAGLIGLATVLIFMGLSYGRMGILADIALIIFGILTLALYKLIPVVLTLPGIAGFLLSVGMAVDSNILIFERFKEEKNRRDFANALEVAFGRAWNSIRDANVATLVTAFVLANPFDWPFLHTSGPVRGFAITLALGILISLYTGIVVSRNLLRVFVKPKGGVKND